MRFDWPTLIVLLVLATGIIWAFDTAVRVRRRRAVARQAEGTPEDLVVAPPPRLVKFSKKYFPFLLLVLVLRSFIGEPFWVPSNSMMPTLQAGVRGCPACAFASGVRAGAMGRTRRTRATTVGGTRTAS